MKGCPFCGTKPRKTNGNYPSYGGLKIWATIGCPKCGYHVKFGKSFTRWELENKDRDEIIKESVTEAIADTERWWNMRVWVGETQETI